MTELKRKNYQKLIEVNRNEEKSMKMISEQAEISNNMKSLIQVITKSNTEQKIRFEKLKE